MSPEIKSYPALVERVYDYKNVKVAVRINFKAETVSLVELHPTDINTPVKKWVFADREIEYHQGWVDILEAMRMAMGEAFMELKEYQDARAVEMEQNVAQILGNGGGGKIK